MQTVNNVHALFELGPVLATSGFATVYALDEDTIVRIQETPNPTDLLDEVRFVQRMEQAGLTPRTLGQYSDETHHAMVSQRYHMDLEEWLHMSTPKDRSCSMWTLRLRRLLRGMAKTGLFCIDLKPANVVVRLESQTSIISEMKLIDFGGGLCWESLDLVPGYVFPWQVLYTAMLIIFNASIKQTTSTDGPFGQTIQSLLRAPQTRFGVLRILGRPLIQRYWSNLFCSVPMREYVGNLDRTWPGDHIVCV